MTSEAVLAHHRGAAGYDRDLGGLEGDRTPGDVAAILADLALVLLVGAASGRPFGPAVIVALLASQILGRRLANPDRLRRLAGIPGSSVPTRSFALISGLLARSRVRRRMMLQDREPLDGRDPALLRRYAREISADLRARAEALLNAGAPRLGRLAPLPDARGDRARDALRRALDRLESPPDAGEDPLDHLQTAIEALESAIAEAQNAREAALAARRREMLRLWPEYGSKEEPLKMGGDAR